MENRPKKVLFKIRADSQYITFLDDVIQGKYPGVRAENRHQALRVSLELAEDFLNGGGHQ